MDVNGSRFHLLFGAADWGRCLQGDRTLADLWSAAGAAGAPADVAWNAGSNELTLRPRLFRFVAAPSDVAPEPDSRRGSGADRFGNLYWIAGDRKRIRVLSAGSGATSDFWPAAPVAAAPQHGDFGDTVSMVTSAPELRGLAVTDDHYLVAGTLQPAGLLIFDLFAGGAPTRVSWPSKINFSPFDMAARPGGGVWILDRENRRYWGLDRRFRVLPCAQSSTVVGAMQEDDFQPFEGAPSRGIPARIFPEGVFYDAASPVDAVDAFAIEALPDGTVLILDRDEREQFSRVLRYRYAQRLGEAISLRSMATQIEEGEGTGFTLVAHDMVFLPAGDTEAEQLIVASADGNQAYAFSLSRDGDRLEMKPLSRFLPMRRFGGKGLLAAGAAAYYDFSDTWVPLTRQQRPRYTTAAQIETRVDGFDSGEPDCVWHRLVLDACIAHDTKVEIFSRAANSREALKAGAWRSEPTLYKRGGGSELPWLAPLLPDERIAAKQDSQGSFELLLQQAEGRFLQLRLVLTGNERATPRLQALRVWYPRFSYAKNYLPGVYREDRDSASFLERFLANIEGLHTALEDKIATVRALFHWQSAPSEALEWLAGWLDASLDPAWDERRRRLFIKHAVNFFQYRGTLHGVRMALALALDPEVCDCALGAPGAIPESRQRYRIIERYRTRRTPGLVFGEPLRNTGPREVTALAQWEPGEGAGRLTQRYRDYLETVGVKQEHRANAVFTLFPPVSREGAAAPESAPYWEPFAVQALGFVPTVAEERRRWQRFLSGEYANNTTRLKADYGAAYSAFEDVPLPANMPAEGNPRTQWVEFAGLHEPAGAGYERRLWQDFLARRYGQIATLNRLYRTNWSGFEVVSLFDRLPADGPALSDWYQFETVVKAMHRHAHRFSALVPSAGPNADIAQVQERLALARRVIELAKPAHTLFDVGFYWALFRTGDARLGFDTRIDVGSRAPELMPSLVLGRHFIGASHLALSLVRPQDQRMTLEGLPVAT